ncbi:MULTISPECIES: transcriptional repressor LexA [Clostridium]|uniref:transcriptional repressor LexA n=1 Tax=Clostridium TaxID=1485 RepID=UPI000826E52A|nr:MULTISPECIES: transcriptional repressor LexA [Clostridium]PJI10185.1 repressor LexA [Clostridium sp. CT7]
MKLSSIQNKIVEDTKHTCCLIKGKRGTGKTTIAACRSIFLKNNYCISKSDNIIVINSSKNKLNNFNEIYSSLYNDANSKYSTLLEPYRKVTNICTLDEIIDKYAVSKISLISERDKIALIKDCVYAASNIYPKIKILNNSYVDFFKDEIEWIKSCGYEDINIYQNVKRIGRNSTKNTVHVRLNKNSIMRECVFKLMLMYNDKLSYAGQFDDEDKTKTALKNSSKKKAQKYTHIIVDEVQELTKLQIDFINSIKRNCKYSSIFFTYDNDSIKENNSWLIKGHKISTICKDKIKSYNLKNTYGSETQTSMEKFTYKDLKHKTSFDFMRDNYETSKIILSGDLKYNKSEVAKIPVFNEIAAGEPILMNPEIKDKFYLPKYWISSAKDCFMLKIKGDSMINAGINDGDYVVIKKTAYAENGNIVAVNIDGSATLKRLKMDKNDVEFMPENEKYSPIKVTEDQQVMLIGIAIGILKVN